MKQTKHDDGRKHDPLKTAMETEDFFRLNNLPKPCPRHPNPVHGAARWATRGDLVSFLNAPTDEEHPFALPDASFLLQNKDGTDFAPLYKRPFYRTGDNLSRNTLIVGQIGSQKTTGLIIPSIAADLRNPQATVVILDIKGNLHHTLEPLIESDLSTRRDTIFLNFTDPNRTTHAWDPFGGGVIDTETALRDTENFFLASETKPNSDSPFWNGTAARGVTALLVCLQKIYGSVCLADVHEAIEWPRERLLQLLNGFPDVRFAAGFRSFLSSDSHNALTALAQAQMHLRALASPGLAAVTSKAEFTFEHLFRRPTVLILEVPQGDLERLRPFLNLFFAQFFRAAAKFSTEQVGCRLPRPVSVYLDDFAAAVGRIPDFGASLNLLRSRDVRITAAVQSLAQFQHYYGTEAEAVIAGFATKIFKTPVELSDAEWASRQSGMTTITELHEEQRHCQFCQTFHTASRQSRPVGRPLLLPDDIRLSPAHFLYGRAATVFAPDVPPFQCWFRPAYDTPGLAEYLAKASRTPRATVLRSEPLIWSPKVVQLIETMSGFTDTRGMTEEHLRKMIEDLKNTIGWQVTEGPARKWWLAFEEEKGDEPALILRVVEELAQRQATVAELYLAAVYANSDNILVVLRYLDYIRLKRSDDQRRKAMTGKKRDQ